MGEPSASTSPPKESNYVSAAGCGVLTSRGLVEEDQGLLEEETKE